MCVFVNDIEVSDTSIFARRPVVGDPRQILVYSMKIYTNDPAVMILPLPVIPGSDEETIRFIDLSDYENYFDDMHQACQPISVGEAAGALDMGLEEEPLAVHQVGDFEASFVPHRDDFRRLDRRFQLDEKVWKQMPDYHDYGFAVFQLSPLARMNDKSKTVHPMAFEFHSRDTDRLFFPTVHVHDGEYHEKAWFDHTLFMQFDNETEARPRIATAYNNIYETDLAADEIVGRYGSEPSVISDEYIEPDIDWVDDDGLATVPFDMYGIGGTNTRFLYSGGPAKYAMDIPRSAGTLDPEWSICALMPRTKLKNQDIWV